MMFWLRMQVLLQLVARAQQDLSPEDFSKFVKEVNRGA